MKNKSPKRKRSTRPFTEQVSVHIPADYCWKTLGFLVEDLDHLFTNEESARLHTIIRNRDYDAYLALGEEWGPQCIGFYSGKTLAQARAIYQVISLIRKFRFESSQEARTQTALKKFKEAERACLTYNLDGYKSLAWAEDDRMCNAFSYARAWLEKVLGVALPSKEKLTLWSRHGPGANLDTWKGLTSTYHKYSGWPYSCTKGAYREARAAIEDDERWRGALEDDYRRKNDIPAHIILDQDAFFADVLNIVGGNRIAFVPKNALTDRSIAIEPSMNLYLQLGVDGYIRRRLKRWGIDLDSQEKNRELARLGSRDWENPENFVTLDLAAASDSISVSLCRLMLPKEWFTYLMKLRSPKGTIGDETISYEKISSMGNGFTFALESAIFASVIYGVMREFEGSYDPAACAVFGDDLIVRNTIAKPVIELLNLFGFTINEEKSFLQGPFRESCGADWLNGRPVRPVFLDETPTSVMDLWTDLNRLRRILSLRFMEEESKTESMLAKWIPEKFSRIYGPCNDESFDSYRHSSKPTVAYKNYLFKFKTLVARPRPMRGKNFLFRKLMHPLREQPLLKPTYITKHRDTWKGLKVSGSGSLFTITRPQGVLVGFANSVASHWQQEYREDMPDY